MGAFSGSDHRPMTTPAHGAASVPPHARRYDITGSHQAAIVLERLQYWSPRTRVRKRGKAWIVKSRADLMWETRLTEKQLWVSLEKLEERDLIQIEQLLFAGKNVTHIRFTPRGVMSLDKVGFVLQIKDPEEPKVVQEGQPEMAPEDRPEMAPQGQLLLHKS